MSSVINDLLNDLDRIPTPNNPGTLRVRGRSYEVFTVENEGNTIIAASLYGGGKVLVFSHNCYLSWLDNPENELMEKFSKNIKAWLTGDGDCENSQIANFVDAVSSDSDLEEYKILKWNHDDRVTEEQKAKLLNYIEFGGALVAGSTPWGYLQVFPDKTLNDMVLNNFLSEHFKIEFTENVLWLQNEIEVSKNVAKLPIFDKQNVRYYDREILAGLEKIPTPNHPGTIIVTGRSQPVFSVGSAGDTFLAAAEYGKGRILVCAHDSYLSLLNVQEPGITKSFIDNVKKWLTGLDYVDPSQIINFHNLTVLNKPFENYKIILWHHAFNATEWHITKLLVYLEHGGSVIAGSTPWGYVQLNRRTKLRDMGLNKFLREHFGMMYTERYLSIGTETEVSKNVCKVSQFDLAIEKIFNDPEKVFKYGNTVQCGIDVLCDEGILDPSKLTEIKAKVLESSRKCGCKSIPSEKEPIRDEKSKTMCKFLSKCINFLDGEKAPGIDVFPGDFDKLPPLLENVELDLSTQFEERVSTGYYLPAGVKLIAKCTGDLKLWTLRIGAHTDDLSYCGHFTRWPVVTTTKYVTETIEICSPFGGLIYFESSGKGSLIVNLSNVVESPYIDLTKPETINDWNRRRNSPGLWAELAGENIILTTPSSCIRHLENPIYVLKFWDEVVKTHHECRGTNVRDSRRERVVNDMQPSAGYMHSGYPIVTHLDCCQKDHGECIFDIDKLMKNGNWGMFHEIGHNMQRKEWTFDGCGEVTVNLFSMHAKEFVVGQELTTQDWPRNVMGEFAGFFSKQPTYEDWKSNCCMGLMTFFQLIKHFGWSSMKTFLKNYEADIASDSENLPKTNQDKIDQWVLRYSKIVNKNIKPQFEMFGLPVSASVDAELAGLEPWCPYEEKNPELFFTKYIL